MWKHNPEVTKRFETGAHVKQSNGNWKWQSLNHTTISRQGTVVGGTVTCSLNAAISEVGLYNAGMKLAYNIDASVVCKGSPISWGNSYQNNSPIWNVNYGTE